MKDSKGGSSTTAVSFSSPAMLNNSDKYNLNDQNLSLRSPCEDPQETKRRRRCGGYNLRKSLTWNKAFFTEEGVLDAWELSRLSKPSPRLLSSVAEEGSSSSFRKGAKVRDAGLNLNSVRGNLFSASPNKQPLMEGRRVTSDSLSTTQSSAQKAASRIIRASRKVQLTKAPSGSVSPGGGCPRPSTLSSQRRLPNSSTLNRTVKDSNISKPTIVKAKSSSLSTVSKNLAVGSKASKLNPPVTAEKNVGLRRGSSLIAEKKPNSASSSSRPYVLRSSKTSEKLSKDKHLSTDLQPPQSVKGTKIGQKTTPQPGLCANKHKAITKSGAEVDNPAALNVNCVSEDIPNPQTQPTKVTGLRMPSPSLRFFDQPKSSASQSIQSVNVQLSTHRDSGIPIARKPSQSRRVVEPKPLLKLDETASLTKGRTETGKAEVKALSPTSKCSVPPVASVDSYTQMKPKIAPRNVQVEANVSDSMSSFDQISSQEESHNLNINVDKQEVEEESTRSHMHDEVGQIRHEVNLGSEPNHTSVCHTYPALLQRDSKLEKQVTATNNKHDEVESILHDVHMGMELSVNQLPLLAGSPEHFQMDNKLEKQETARNKKQDEVESILHDVHMGMELSGNQLPPHAGSPEHFQMDNYPEKQEDARNNKNGEGDQIMHELNLGSLLHEISFVCHTSPVQVQKDDQLEKQEIARDQNHVTVEQIYHGVQMGMRKDNHLEKQEDNRDYIHDGVDQIMDEVNSGQQLSPSTGCPISPEPEQEQRDNHTEKQEDATNNKNGEGDQIMHEVNLGSQLHETSYVCHTSPVQVQNDDQLEKQEIARDQNHVTGEYHGVQMGIRKDNLQKQEDSRDYIHDGVDQIMDKVNLGQQLNSSTGCSISPEQEQKDNHTEKQEDARHHIKDEVDQVMHEVSLRPELNNSLLPSLTFPEQTQTDNDLEKQEVAANHIHDEVAANHIHDEDAANHIHDEVAANHISDEDGDVDMELELSDDDLSPLCTGYHGVSQGLEISYVEKGQLKSLCTDISNDTCVTIPSILGDGDDNSVAFTSAVNVVAHSVNRELGEVAELINQCPDRLEKSNHFEESQEICYLGSISDVQTPEGLVMQLKESCSKGSNIEKILQAKNSHFEPLPTHPPDHSDMSQNCCPEDFNKQAEELLVLQESHHVWEMKGSTPLLDAEECLNVGKPYHSEVKVDQLLEINDSISFLNEEKMNLLKPFPNEVDADLQDGNPISEINDCTSPFYDEDQLNDRKFSSTEAEIDLRGGYHALDMSDGASILESVSSEKLEKDNTLVFPTITLESIIQSDLEITYPSGNLCQNLQAEERDAVDDSNIQHPHVEVAAFQCLESKPLAENHESPYATPNKYPSEHNSPQVSVRLQSTLKISEDQTANSVATCVSTSNGFMDNDLKNCTSLEKTHTTPFRNSETPNGALQSELQHGVFPQKAEASTMGSKGNSLEVPNKDSLALKKLNALPFSDEWLAALEAAGEDILTMKTGAVQNSPPDKSVPETTSPWSPVKRRHQEIGPFDCTKCTNLPAAPSN